MSKFLDLTGQHFGQLEALCIDKEKTKEKHKTYWKCRCSCGREKSIRLDYLTGRPNIKNKSCGECTNDYTGQRFGRLIAIERSKNDKNGHAYWLCKCDCGNIVEILGSNLVQGYTKSCGCLHKETMHNLLFKDIAGMQFNNLTVLKLNYIKNSRKPQWLCQCKCGNIISVDGGNLKNGHTKSCGCLNSVGEHNIIQCFIKNNIVFEKEKIFKDLKGLQGKYLRYDFYLPDYNRLIEFDGRQHFSYTGQDWDTKENFKKTQKHDKIKNEYALSHNIPLVRIPYWEVNNITLDLLLDDTYLVQPGKLNQPLIYNFQI